VGLAVSGFLVNGVIALGGWRAVFLVLTALALLICVPAVFFLVRDDVPHGIFAIGALSGFLLHRSRY
jgi:hypothetical protein